MMSRIIAKRHILPGIVFVLVLGFGLYAIDSGKSLLDKNLNLTQQQLLPKVAQQIETSLFHSFSSAHTLAQEVRRSNGSFSDFDSYAAEMMNSFPQVSAFQLAPLGRVTEIYPSAANPIAIGSNVLGHQHSASAAQAALRAEELMVSKPFLQDDGSSAVTAWNPVYLDDNGLEQFWGFTSVTVAIDALFDSSGVSAFQEMQSSYQVAWIDPATQDESVFYSVGNWENVESMSTVIDLPQSGHWELRVSTCSSVAQWQLLIAYLLSLMLAWSTAAYFRSADALRHRLSQLVARRTRELNHIAYHDSLTDLPNHRRFYSLLDSELTCNAEPGTFPTVVLIDLDLFSEVNDAFGQHGGDTLLINAAKRIRNCLPDSATLARWGDDEFIVLIKDHSVETVESMVAVISRSLSKPCAISDSEVSVSACIGVASTGGEVTCADDLLSWSQQALVSAKALGKNEVCWYSEQMRRECKRKLILVADLKTAINRNELELFFQPIVACDSGLVDKAECLLRWNHPTLGLVSPVEFIPIAEETGLIRDIGNWVFEQSVRTVKHWRQNYNRDFSLSVNVSPVQLNRQGTVSRWLDLLNEYDVPENSILIEITEGILLDENTAAYAQIDELRKAGVPLALDDFGTGYSSMSYLKVFAIDYIKIDRSFVSNLTESREDMILCDAIIAIADKMNIKVVAEGVETLELHKILTVAGSDYSQGYYFSRPVRSDEFIEKFLRSRESMVA